MGNLSAEDVCAQLFSGMNVWHEQIYKEITGFAIPLEFSAPIFLLPFVHSAS